MLSKGIKEAAFVFAWGILPLGVWAMVGDFVPLIMLFGISVLAFLLRETESWEFTLLAGIFIGLAVEAYLRMQPVVLDTVFIQLQPYLQQNNIQGIEEGQLRETITSIIGAVYMFLAIVLTMLSRWMQAALFNPGGFKQEIHQLRIEQKIAIGLLGLMLLASFGIIINRAADKGFTSFFRRWVSACRCCKAATSKDGVICILFDDDDAAYCANGCVVGFN